MAMIKRKLLPVFTLLLYLPTCLILYYGKGIHLTTAQVRGATARPPPLFSFAVSSQAEHCTQEHLP